MMVYIAATEPLGIVAWNDAQPAFYVSELRESEASVRQQFDMPHVFYAGSHEGCGCGFQYGEYPQFEDEDRPLKRASLDAFAAYLAEQLKRVPSIQLYACWDGDQLAPPEHQRALTPGSLRSEDFFFLQKERSTIEPDAA
jgi:hypothetical protein